MAENESGFSDNPLDFNPGRPEPTENGDLPSGAPQNAPTHHVDSGDPFGGRPSVFNDNQKDAVKNALEEGVRRLKERRTSVPQEGLEMPPGGPEPGFPLDPPESTKFLPTAPPPGPHESSQEPSGEPRAAGRYSDLYQGRREAHSAPEEGSLAYQQSMSGYHTTAEFERLLKIGYDTHVFELNGNKILLRTLTQEEEIQALERSMLYPEGMRAGMFLVFSVAQSIVSINRKRWFTRVAMSEDDEDQILQEKVAALSKLYRPVIDVFLGEYEKLQQSASAKAEFALKK